MEPALADVWPGLSKDARTSTARRLRVRPRVTRVVVKPPVRSTPRAVSLDFSYLDQGFQPGEVGRVASQNRQTVGQRNRSDQ